MASPLARGLCLHEFDRLGGRVDPLRAAFRALPVHDWDGLEDETPLVVIFESLSAGLLELVRSAGRRGECPVIAVAWGRRLTESAGWELLDAGAADVLTGDDPARLAGLIEARVRHWAEREEWLRTAALGERCVGVSPAWRRLMRDVVTARENTSVPILLHGESGTGKEVVARLLHDLGGDARGPMVTVDCTTIVRELAGSELFGHVRGAFTGAQGDREGAFAAADGGTLFLDEIGDLPPALQPELLRVVQEGTYKAVGSNVWHRTRFRLLAATHRDLAKEVADGRFRLDLYHRLTGWRIHLPPLRDRMADVPHLVDHFLRELAPGSGGPLEVSDEVRHFLQTRPYPGNVRELKNVVRRLVLRRGGAGVLTLGCVAPEDRPAGGVDPFGWLQELESATDHALARGVTLKELATSARECMVRAAVRSEGGSLQKAARRLGVTDRALQIRAAGKLRVAAGGE